MKSLQRIKAIELRKNGLSINQISTQLSVSKSSVSIWVRDISLCDDMLKKLEQQNPILNRQLSGAKKRGDLARSARILYQEEGKIKAKEKDFLHHAGCMLYWAEGEKSKNTCGFVNSDVEMMKLFLQFLKQNFQLDESKIRIHINCYTTNGLSKKDIEDFWLTNLDLNKNNLGKTIENIRPRSVTNKIRHHKLLYGVCRVRICSTQIVQHIYGAIQEYIGVHNNYMLDRI